MTPTPIPAPHRLVDEQEGAESRLANLGSAV